jgi:parallel beta-helix repeat protein
MTKRTLVILIGAALLFSAPAFAIDGVILINQSTVMAAGGFPYTITQPGSYKLSGNLVVPANTDGIDIATFVSNITIDLNGFSIIGPASCTGVGACAALLSNGISATDSTNITLRNGTVTGFGDGIFLNSTTNNLIEEVRAIGNGNGIEIRGSNSLVRRNIASSNGQHGILAVNAVVIENVANSNGGDGLLINGGVFGSNSFDSNTNAFANSGATSQKNNDCNGTAC